MNFGLPPDTIAKINRLFAAYPQVSEAIIYGSRAKGNYRPGSDIDLTLKGEDLTGALLSEIQRGLDELNTPYLFDISVLATLNSPDLQDHINRVGQVFYSKPGKEQ